MFNRILKLPKSNSFFLFGARGVGKSTLLKDFFSGKNALSIDLLKPEVEDRFLRSPSELAGEVKKLSPPIIILDEIQKVPKLLDVVQSLMFEFPKIQHGVASCENRVFDLHGQSRSYKCFYNF